MSNHLELRTIAVIGAGAMGTGIAQVAATAGHEVLLYEHQPEQRAKSLRGLQRILNRQVEKGRMTDLEVRELLGRIRYVENLTDLGTAELVIEAIVENLEIKRSVFAQLEDIVSEDAILATNTSSLPVTAIAAACAHPGRVLGIHFFNPAPLMKLVEVIPAVQTDAALPACMQRLLESWGKIVVRAKDTPGFIVNRVARPFYGESLRILEEGIADAPTIDAAMRDAGFRMGPFQLMDYIGHDVNYKVTETVFAAFYYDPRYRPSFTQQRLVDAGWLGRKTGRGFYQYGENVPAPPAPSEDAELHRRVVDRILAMLINEAADAAYLNVAKPADIDLAMRYGTNYPKGLLAWGEEIGFTEVVRRLDALYDFYREDRYRCSPGLRRRVGNDERSEPNALPK